MIIKTDTSKHLIIPELNNETWQGKMNGIERKKKQKKEAKWRF